MSTSTAIWIAVGLWFAIGWYLNLQLNAVHAKIDKLFEQFDGLREYLYEIDPQFDDERELLDELFPNDDRISFAGMDHLGLTKRKKEEGFRTLHSSFSEGSFRAPNR